MHGIARFTAFAAAAMLAGCAAQSIHSSNSSTAPMTAHAGIQGIGRTDMRDALVGYCTGHGYRIVHQSLTDVVCRKREDGIARSHLAPARTPGAEPTAPVLTVSFRFFPDAAGMMQVRATGHVARSNHQGDTLRTRAPLGRIQHALEQTRRDWYARHPQFAPASAG